MSSIDSHDDHPPFLAHHWENPQQQFEAGKLGMWLFLGTEFLLFGGLFCAYAVYRFNHPELFEYGSQFLNTRWGAINTVVLILSSLTMAMSVTAAQMGRTRMLVTLLTLTFLGGAAFMGIKYIEYKHKFEHNIVWGTGLYVPPARGPEGGDAHAADTHAAAAASPSPSAPAAPVVPVINEDDPDAFVITRSQVAPAATGPGGLSDTYAEDAHEGGDDAQQDDGHSEPDPRTDPNRPPNAHIFFGIYFCMTGLHGLHVLAGMGVIGWLIYRSARGEFGPAYFTPVDLGGLYWHVVDLIWIFLFPLLYLIG